jgi:hypothetical protein
MRQLAEIVVDNKSLRHRPVPFNRHSLDEPRPGDIYAFSASLQDTRGFLACRRVFSLLIATPLYLVRYRFIIKAGRPPSSRLTAVPSSSAVARNKECGKTFSISSSPPLCHFGHGLATHAEQILLKV